MLLMGVAAAAAAPAPPPAAHPLRLAPNIEKDVQCVVFYLMAAGTEKDPAKLQGAIAGSWYFVGRLDVAAPGLNLEQAIRQELAAMQGKPGVKELASACDVQLSKRGADLVDLGARLQKTP
jgi:hypothetical protein